MRIKFTTISKTSNTSQLLIISYVTIHYICSEYERGRKIRQTEPFLCVSILYALYKRTHSPVKSYLLSNECTIKYSKKNVKIYIKINIKSAATCFGPKRP